VLHPTRHITRYIGVEPSQAIDATATDNQVTSQKPGKMHIKHTKLILIQTNPS